MSSLTNDQEETKSEIINYGRDNNYSEDDIQYAVNAAFIESSLGQNTDNGVRYSSGTRSGQQVYHGIYQYNHDTWASRHADKGSITDSSAQIKAIYSDVDKFTKRYEKLTSEQRKLLSREEYMYSKHHGGNNYDTLSKKNKYDELYRKRSEENSSMLKVPAPAKGSGGGAGGNYISIEDESDSGNHDTPDIPDDGDEFPDLITTDEDLNEVNLDYDSDGITDETLFLTDDELGDFLSDDSNWLEGTWESVTDWWDDVWDSDGGYDFEEDFDPLVLDLDGDGIELINAEVQETYFSLSNDEFTVQTSWLSGDDGFLALDRNQDGVINNIGELFGNDIELGFDALAALDHNSDGVINSSDAQFAELLVWQDKNGDGVSQADELNSLEALGIESVNLSYSAYADPDTVEEDGTITHIGQFTRTDGSSGLAADINLWSLPSFSRYIGEYTLDEDVLAVSNIKGYGTLPDLHIAMSLNNELKQTVLSLSQAGSLSALVVGFDQLLQDWAQTQDVSLEDLGLENHLSVDGVTGNVSFALDSEGNSRFGKIEFSVEQLAMIQAYAGQQNLAVLEDDYHEHESVNWFELGPAAYYQQSWNELNRNLLAKFAVTSGLLSEVLPGASYDPILDQINLADETLDNLDQVIDGLVSDLNGISNNSDALTEKAILAIVLAESEHSIDIQLQQKLSEALESNPGLRRVLDNELFGLLDIGSSANDVLNGEEDRRLYLSGNGGNDIILGAEFNDMLFGGTGDDFINAQEGDDHVEGGQGNDRLQGSDGNDFVDGGAGNDDLKGGDQDDVLIGGHGDDLVDGGADNDELYGDQGNDQLDGSTGDDLLKGGIGNDVLDGGADNDVLYGESGNDDLKGADGDDSLDGGIGHDYLKGGDGNDVLLGGVGNDKLAGGNDNDHLDGGVGNDILAGDKGDDLLEGGAGSDTLDGGKDNDILLGGAGNDALLGDDGDDQLEGAAGNDQLDGGDGNDQLDGGAGSDMLDGGKDNDVLIGGAGNDTLIGDKGDDVLEGGVGSDTLDGGKGDDVLSGEAGNDLLDGGDDIDHLDGGLGNDTLIGGTQNDYLIGGLGNDSLDGGKHDDSLFGGMGNDLLIGGHGDDLLDGGDGDDSLYGGEGHDTLLGAAGNDILYGEEGDDQLNGSLGNDTLLGGLGDDHLLGAVGNDTLSGGAGDDLLFGGAGDDQLYAGAGHDILQGGQGDDSYYADLQAVGLTTIKNIDSTIGDDSLTLQGVSAEDVSFTQQGNSLHISADDNAGEVVVANWFADEAYQLSEVTLEDGSMTSSQINQLINAMSAFEAANEEDGVSNQAASSASAVPPLLTA